MKNSIAFLYLQKSYFWNQSEKSKYNIRDRLIPLSEITRIYDAQDSFGICIRNNNTDLFIDKVDDSEEMYEFYNRTYFDGQQKKRS